MNHPNRSWRAKMRAACSEWLHTWTWPQTTGGAWVYSPEQIRDLMAQSYRAGYEAGRESLQRPKAPE